MQKPRQLPPQLGLVVALALIFAALALARPNFLTLGNLVNLLRQISINGILAVGVTYVLLTGGVDLSLGSVAALSGVAAALFAQPGGLPAPMAVLLGVATGAACGAVNGAVVTRARIAPFIVTLGMMTAARGAALVASGGRPVSNLSRGFIRLGGGDVLGVPLPVLVFAAVALGAHLFLAHFKLGRYLYAVGGSENAARASGLRVNRIKLFAYAFAGALAGLAGVVLAGRITTGQPNAGVGYELDAIAACVVGGASLNGGVGGIGGAVLGALLMGVINNGLDLLNVSSYYQQIVKGVIIVGAVCLDRSKRK